MLMQVKLFYAISYEALEESINDFLERMRFSIVVVDIKVEPIQSSLLGVVIYKITD